MLTRRIYHLLQSATRNTRSYLSHHVPKVQHLCSLPSTTTLPFLGLLVVVVFTRMVTINVRRHDETGCVVLTTQEEFEFMLKANDARCLVDEGGKTFYGFVNLDESATYSFKAKKVPSRQRPPTSAHSDDRFGELLEQKLEQLRMDIGVRNQKATPVLTPSHLGEKELRDLENSNRISTYPGEAGQPACLTGAEIEELSHCRSESAVVAFLTPLFEKIFENLAVVNSEEYTWLKVSSDTNRYRYNQKPDMLVCHRAIYKKREESITTDETKSLRTADFKFGVLADWVLRDCMSATLEAKIKINKAAFGEVVNYGRHLSLKHPEPNDVRIVLFDKTEFWLVTFAKGVCAVVTKCQWVVEGSSQLLKSFARASSTWLEVLDSVCSKLGLVVPEGDAFIGYGSFGRVFRVFRRDGRQNAKVAMALKIVLGVDTVELEAEAESMLGAISLVPEHVMAVQEVKSVENGAGLLLSCVGRTVERAEFCSVVEALAALHANGIYHGDPRIANAVYAAGNIRWLDFRGARFYPGTTPGLFKDDMTTLVCSLLSVTSLASFPRIADAVEDYGSGDFSVQRINTVLTDCLV